jgi:hypothetical protein
LQAHRRSGNKKARKATMKEGDRECLLRGCDEKEKSKSI